MDFYFWTKPTTTIFLNLKRKWCGCSLKITRNDLGKKQPHLREIKRMGAGRTGNGLKRETRSALHLFNWENAKPAETKRQAGLNKNKKKEKREEEKKVFFFCMKIKKKNSEEKKMRNQK